MKLSWLLPALLGGGAAPPLDTVGIAVSEKALGCEHQILRRQGITDQDHRRVVSTQQYSQDDDDFSRESPAADVICINFDEPNVSRQRGQQTQNETESVLHTQPQDQDNLPGDSIRRVTFKPKSQPQTTHPPDLEAVSTQQSELPIPDPNPAAETEAEPRIDSKNPASANRALAGMSAGLVSVMLVFVVFL
ncbi:hypothetical protein VTI74DRAFT_2102 [Chaetomium olivicolor]